MLICRICKSSSLEKFISCHDHEFTKKQLDLYKCSLCEVITVVPAPSIKSLEKYYSSTYYHKPGILSNFLQFLRKRKFSNIKPGKVLDVGCGSGNFLRAMHSLDWECYGTEISKSSHEFLTDLRLNGTKIYHAFLPDAKFKRNYFDLITLWHVLEHLHNPSSYLTHVKKILKKGGKLLIAVPNIESISFKLWSCNWFNLDPPRHLNHFTPHNLKKLLEREGFKIISINHHSFEFNPYSILQSFYNSLGFEFNFLYRFMKGTTKSKGTDFYLNLFFTLLTIPIVLPLSILFAYLFSFLGYGDAIDVLAKKK